MLQIWQAAATFTPDGGENAPLRFAIRVARNLAVSDVRSYGRPDGGRACPSTSRAS